MIKFRARTIRTKEMKNSIAKGLALRTNTEAIALASDMRTELGGKCCDHHPEDEWTSVAVVVACADGSIYLDKSGFCCAAFAAQLSLQQDVAPIAVRRYVPIPHVINHPVRGNRGQLSLFGR